MIKKIAVAFIAVVLLSACSSSRGKHTAHSGNSLIAEFERTIGDRVFFKYDSADLTTEAQTTLKRQAEWLKNHPSFNLTVEGHCDERGTREYNIALGERRANSVKSFLTKHGITAERVDMISYGKERPAVVGDDEAAFNQNRRGVTALR